MNTNPNAKVILCYGDSNTYGQTPDRSGRYPVDVRWPGVLQQKPWPCKFALSRLHSNHD